MIGRICRATKGHVIVVGALLLGATAILASARPLFVNDAAAQELGCVDIGCRSNTQCQEHECDLCHTDNRCGLVAVE